MTLGLFLSLAGDILWIIGLSVMAGISRKALAKIPKGVSVPMLWDAKRMVVWRAPRMVGVALLVVMALVGGLVLLWLARTADTLQAQTIWFGVRALIAPLLALAHVTHMKRALQTLGAEGRLIP